MSVFLTLNPSEWVAYNALAFAIIDKYPVSTGHTLVIPHRVIPTWWEATVEEQQALLELVEQVKTALDAEYSPDGYNVGFNAGSAAGQTIDHLHVHVIPRYNGDMDDPRGGVRHVIPDKGSYLRPAPSAASLVTPLNGRLRLELVRCLVREDLDRIDLLVSFVKRSGIDLIAARVDEALARGARIRLLTTDYLQITEAAALGFFLDRLGSGPDAALQVRVFSDPGTSFHPKAYIFSSSSNAAHGVAFVGSSNLTRSGITTGVEWNVQTHGTTELHSEFNRLWKDPRSLPLTASWLDNYDQLQRARHQAQSTVSTAIPDEVEIDEEPEAALAPWSVQAEALSALEATRIEGHQAGLVVMATGLGKTWLAAFDSTRPEFRRILFIAHRDEILAQARDTYRAIRPGARLTLFNGHERDPDGQVVFASVQSLHRNLDNLNSDHFDYVVIDEFHHAAAGSYRRIIAHFQPRFLLGLTATPHRSDAADLLSLCGDNLVYDCGLVEGIRRGLLSTFHYRAIADTTDYEHIPWRNGRFDIEALTTHIATRERAQQVLDEWRSHEGETRRALGFCCSIAHADFMAEYFREHGVNAVAVHSGFGSASRVESLELLAAGEIPVVFTVDLFNEGVDVPTINLVLMLRPTESAIVFLQQLGRGLRRAEGKERLDVIDLVGNHRAFLLKARVLIQIAGFPHLTAREAVRKLADQPDHPGEVVGLPEGCLIILEPEAIDILQNLLGRGSDQDRLVELIRQWMDDHEGEPPTALEMALATGTAHKLKPRGGWFGLLNELGLLSDVERSVLREFGNFLVWIEHGAYTKSYKLITLRVLSQIGNLATGASLREIAATSRWMIFNDPDLRTDLADASAAIADVAQPTTSEWESYWRKNPIKAMTSADKGQNPWFVEESGWLRFAQEIPERLGPTLEMMARELVDYRLHRYLLGQSAKRAGEVRHPIVDGIEIDATFLVEGTGATATSVVIESAGGAGEDVRNGDYVRGVDVVLERLTQIGARLVDAYIDTRRVMDIPIAERRLDPGEGNHYPIELTAAGDLINLRRALLRSMATVGRAPGVAGGGNSRKRFRLILSLPEAMTTAHLADALEAGRLVHRGFEGPAQATTMN